MTSSAYWVNQIREPVQFQNAVRLAQQYNANVFLEVGPQPTLTNFGRQSLNEHAALWLPSLSQRRPDCDLMFSSLAQFYESGGELKWAKMFERDKSDQHIARRVALPSYPFQRTRHWLLPDELLSTLNDQPTVEKKSREHGELPVDNDLQTDIGLDRLSPLASALNACWRDVLGVRQISLYDDFFDLGGHSLMILQLVDRIKESIRLSVPNSTLTENPRFEDFCIAVEALLDEQGSEQNEDDALQINPPKLTADESQLYEPFPLVELQQSFLMGRRSDFGLGGVSTHLYFELRPNGLDVSRFVSSLNALIQRHDMLRAVIVGESEQKILEHVPYYEPKIYAINDSTIDAHLETVRKEMSHQVLPEDKWPLFDFRLTQQSDGEHVIHVSMDLLMLDVRSNQILFRDLDLLYAGRGSDLPNIPISYRDYVIAEQQNINSHTFERAKNYWLDRIASFPLAPDLPLAGNPANIHYWLFMD